jgi:AcrR family transcriptional regulator
MAQAAEALDTRTLILGAAKQVLRERGYAALSTREVATAAGVPLSQIHYHFGSKRGLLIALYEYLDAQNLARQQALFHDASLSLADQWDRACDYLDEDMASGYVRVGRELAAAGWADPEIAKMIHKSYLGWIRLLIEVARKFEARIGGFGSLSAEEVVALVANAFIGAENHLLSGLEQGDFPVRRSLRRIGALIRTLEQSHG